MALPHYSNIKTVNVKTDPIWLRLFRVRFLDPEKAAAVFGKTETSLADQVVGFRLTRKGRVKLAMNENTTAFVQMHLCAAMHNQESLNVGDIAVDFHNTRDEVFQTSIFRDAHVHSVLTDSFHFEADECDIADTVVSFTFGRWDVS